MKATIVCVVLAGPVTLLGSPWYAVLLLLIGLISSILDRLGLLS